MICLFSEQELAEFIFDRILVHCPKCPDVECIRIACQAVAGELLKEAEIRHKATEPASDGGA